MIVVSGVGFTDLGPREERTVNRVVLESETKKRPSPVLISQIQVFSGSPPTVSQKALFVCFFLNKRRHLFTNASAPRSWRKKAGCLLRHPGR